MAASPNPTTPAHDLVLATIAGHASSLLGTARRYSLCADDAQDAYQRALEIFLRRADAVDPDHAVGWLRTVVKHEALAVRAGRLRLVGAAEVDLDREEASHLVGADERAADREHAARAAEALQRIKPQETRALLLKAQGYSYKEIADICGWTYTKVNRCLTEGRRAFLERFEQIASGRECARWEPVLSALAEGEASAEDLAGVRPHLGACQGCRAALRGVRAMSVRRLAAVLLAAVVLAALLPVALPSPARAGSYVVRACAGDATNNSWWASASSGLTASTACPAADYDGVASGLVARSTQNANGGSVPAGAGAWQQLDAPAGATLSSISFHASAGRPSGCWGIGLYAWSDGDPNAARHVWGYDADCNAVGGGWSYYVGPYTIDLGGVAHVRAGVRCDSPGGCPTGSDIPAWANLKDVAVTVVDDSPPAISANAGALWGDGWMRGRQEAWAAYSDNVGVRHIYGQVDDGQPFSWHEFDDPGWPASVRCDYSRSRPCRDIPNGGLRLDTATVPDGAHTLRVGAIDAAGNRAARERTIRVDNTAPAPPRDVTVAGGDGWRRTNGFAVGWANPPGQAAPIVRAHWRLCPADRQSECTTGSRDGDGIHEVGGLEVAGTGDYTLALSLEDGAGNLDPASAAPPVHLRLDVTPPRSPGFEASDPADPRRLALSVADEGSGVASASIQVRRHPEGEWRTLATELRDGRAWSQIPDLELPAGPYDVRALLRDGAGNETTVSADALGRPMGLVLPVRTPTRLTADRRLRLRFGKAGRLIGQLATAAKRPVAHATVALLARVAPGRHFRPAGAVQTDGQGRFAADVPAGPARTIRFAFGGDDLLLPANADARVLVPAAAVLHANRRRVRNGRRVTFAGRLLGGPIPAGGRTVDLQAHYRAAWRTFATPRTDRLGRFRFVYRFGATVGRVVYRFRVLVKPEAAYPYQAGRSPVVKVTVVG